MPMLTVHIAEHGDPLKVVQQRIDVPSALSVDHQNMMEPDSGAEERFQRSRRSAGQPARWHVALGLLLLVLGTGVAAYCGYTAKYKGELQPDWLRLSGWTAAISGLVLSLLGMFQMPFPVRRL